MSTKLAEYILLHTNAPADIRRLALDEIAQGQKLRLRIEHMHPYLLIPIIKAIRPILNLGLKEAKIMVDNRCIICNTSNVEAIKAAILRECKYRSHNTAADIELPSLSVERGNV